MKQVRFKQYLKLFFIYLLILVVSFTFVACYSRYQTKKLTISINNWVGNVVTHLESKYPNISMEEIISLLNAEDSSNELLKELGINSDNVAILGLKSANYQFLLLGISSILFFSIFVIIGIIYYQRKKNKTIKEIINFVKAINQNDYSLQIEKNGEGELYILKSELYKIMVKLKEENFHILKEKEALKNSVEDISHQLKTPLTSIRILLDSLENERMDPQLKKEFLRDIDKQTENMQSLIITLLKLARFDVGVVKMKKEPINLKDLLENVKDNLAILLDLKNQEIVINGKKDIFLIGDYFWLLEAFTNIAKNGLEHSDENTKLLIKYDSNPLMTKIVIQDGGAGISLEDQKHIFERFYKSKNANHNGFGIGLSLAKTIIEQNNGYIKCRSEVGKGTTFEIKILKK